MSLITQNMLVGSFEDTFDRNILKENNVKSILNVANELNFAERLSMSYDKVGIDDDSLTSV